MYTCLQGISLKCFRTSESDFHVYCIISGVSTRGACLVDMQESTHRKLMEVDLFAPWILTHDVLPGEWSHEDVT